MNLMIIEIVCMMLRHSAI